MNGAYAQRRIENQGWIWSQCQNHIWSYPRKNVNTSHNVETRVLRVDRELKSVVNWLHLYTVTAIMYRVTFIYPTPYKT